MDEVRRVLASAESATEAGATVAGFVSYEAAPAFDPAFEVLSSPLVPLAEFHVYRRLPLFYKELLAERADALLWKPDTDEPSFTTRIEEVKRLLAEGETYQVNLTFRFESDRRPGLAALLAQLTGGSPPPYASLYSSSNMSLLSLSPELFFELEDGKVRCKPMKGTASSSEPPERLRLSEKDRAENVMVVDMVRNDLGRIAKVGSVRIDGLFHVEHYPTVLQMTSTIEAQVSGGIVEVFGALFPSASIVGAPKVATMRHIKRLEDSPRGVYTGAIGWAAPRQRARFSVAIRTVCLRPDDSQATYGVGSGVVWDSDASSEYKECLLKAAALQRESDPWGLLETMRWTPSEGYSLLELHVERLVSSAEELGVPADTDSISKALQEAARDFEEPRRVRLVSDVWGRCSVESSPLKEGPAVLRARLAHRNVSSGDPALRHKTTRRGFYDQFVEASGSDEAVLWNERGEVTEFCNGNLVVEVSGKLVTPPPACGLIPGTFRRKLLDDGTLCEEAVLLGSLRGARVWRINSVRGWQQVRLLDDPRFSA